MCCAVVCCAVVCCAVVWCSVVWCGVVICVVGSVGTPPENLMQATINQQMMAMSNCLLIELMWGMQYLLCKLCSRPDCGFLHAFRSEADIINGNVS